MKAFSRFLASANNGPLWSFFGVGILLLSWGLRMPGGDIPYLFAGATLVIMAVFFILVRIFVRLVFVLKKQTGATPALAGWSTWMLCAGALLVLGVVAALDVPFRLAFAASLPQLEQYVETFGKSPTLDGNSWAGCFPISSVVPIDGGVQFTFRKSEIPWGKRGVYYSGSGGSIERSYFYDQERIGSKWFSWHHGGW